MFFIKTYNTKCKYNMLVWIPIGLFIIFQMIYWVLIFSQKDVVTFDVTKNDLKDRIEHFYLYHTNYYSRNNYIKDFPFSLNDLNKLLDLGTFYGKESYSLKYDSLDELNEILKKDYSYKFFIDGLKQMEKELDLYIWMFKGVYNHLSYTYLHYMAKYVIIMIYKLSLDLEDLGSEEEHSDVINIDKEILDAIFYYGKYILKKFILE